MTTRLVPYPKGNVRQLMRLPILGYRLGLGSILEALQIMVLTTRGRISDEPRHTAVEYREHGSKLYVVSIWGDRPNWYQNLLKCPEVTIQRGAHIYPATAQPVTNSGEALRVLHLFRRRAPGIYDSIIARLSARESIDSRTLHEVTDKFTIVRIEPHSGTLTLPPVPVNNRWMLPATLTIGILALFAFMMLLRAPRSRRLSG